MVLKLVPKIVTDAPIAPLAGVKPVRVGDGITIKLVVLATVIPVPLTATVIGPVVAPAGTVVVRLVEVEAVTIANVPLKRTTLFVGVVLKFVPVIITVALTAPLPGLKPESVGVDITIKGVALVRVVPFMVMEIGPVAAPTGTVVVNVVEVDAVTTAGVPLKVILLSAGAVLKFVPDMVTVVPSTPDAGVNPVSVGSGATVKLVPVVTVIPLVVTLIGPVVAPAGTLVTILVEVDDVTVATVPLNMTTLLPGKVLKLFPVIVTCVFTAPLSGLKLVIVGVGSTVKLDALVTVTPLEVTEI